MEKHHPSGPRSNVAKIGSYRDELLVGSNLPFYPTASEEGYDLVKVRPTVITNEDLTPGCPPQLTSATVGKFLRPLSRELDEVPPRPSFDELPESVKDRMVARDKAFWVDKPGLNAYTLHEAAHIYKMTTEKVLPTHQDVFPRSYQYDLDCIQYRRQHACDGLTQSGSDKKPVRPHCRNCAEGYATGLTPFQLAWIDDPGAIRWKYYPDVQATLSRNELKERMTEVGRPFRNEACTWYNENYPSAAHQLILRKFS